MGLETAVVVGLALTAIGGGISAYNSFQSAATSRNIANYNYQMQSKRAQQEQMMATAQAAQMNQQARFQESQAKVNVALAQNEAQARMNNAQSIRNQAEAQTSVDRENSRRARLDMERMRATQRAAGAKSGAVLETMSSRDIGTETEREMEIALNEAHYQSDLGRRKSFGEAALEQFGGEMAKAGAQVDLSSGLAEASLTRSTAALKEAEGAAAYTMGMRKANIDRMSGYADAKGSQLQGWGTLFQTAGSTGTDYGTWKYKAK